MGKFCTNCGKELNESQDFCLNCGVKIKEKEEIKEKKNGKKKILFIVIPIALVITIITIIIIIISSISSSVPEIDITMNSWYGNVETILEDLDLDFYAVTSGANCYSGMKKNEFNTEKYGILYTEFTYCKSNDMQRLRVYNDSRDQKLRKPRKNEIYTYDSYGDREY